LNLQWSDTNSSPQEQGYRVRIKPEGGSYPVGQNVTSYPVSGLSLYTKYYWNVQALGNGTSTLDSPWANSGVDWSFTTVRPQPFPFFDDFSSDKGWIGYETEGWERKEAKAGGGGGGYGSPDPGRDYTGDGYILGFAIGGNYPPGLPIEGKSIVSPPINCSDQSRVFLKFRRWLNAENNHSDVAKVGVSTDGSTWKTVWENPRDDLKENNWTLAVYDIKDVAAHKPTVYISFTMGPTNWNNQFSGWNIDDLEVTSESIYPVEGTTGTTITIPWMDTFPGSGFGAKKGTLLIETTRDPDAQEQLIITQKVKVDSWTDKLIKGTISKSLGVGVYDLIIKTKTSPPEIRLDASFSVVGPKIESVEPSSGQYRDQVTIEGKYFGKKAGKVSLCYKVGEHWYGWLCSIVKGSWTMNPETGISSATCTVPCGPMYEEYYDVAISNPSASATDVNEKFQTTTDQGDCRKEPDAVVNICPPDCGW
jgi:hypothetical protein